MPAKLKAPPAQLFKKLGGLPFELDQMQRNVDKATRPARSNPENDARTIEGVTCPGSGTFRVAHGLGRRPRSYTVTRRLSGDARFTESSRTSRFLVFDATQSGVFDLKVW